MTTEITVQKYAEAAHVTNTLFSVILQAVQTNQTLNKDIPAIAIMHDILRELAKLAVGTDTSDVWANISKAAIIGSGLPSIKPTQVNEVSDV